MTKHPCVVDFRKSLARFEAARVESLRKENDRIKAAKPSPSATRTSSASSYDSSSSLSTITESAAEGSNQSVATPVEIHSPGYTAKPSATRPSPSTFPRTIPVVRCESDRETGKDGQIYHNCWSCSFPFQSRHDHDYANTGCSDCSALDEEMSMTSHGQRDMIGNAAGASYRA